MKKSVTKNRKKPNPTRRGLHHVRADASHADDTFLSMRAAASIVKMPRDQLRQRFRDAGVGPSAWRGQSPMWSARDLWTVVGPGALNPETMGPTDRRAWYGAERLKLDMSRKATGLVRAEDAAAAYARVASLLIACIREAVVGLERLGATPQMVAAAHRHFASTLAVLEEFGSYGARPAG